MAIKNIENNSYNFEVFCKAAISNVQIKPHWSISPSISIGVFKKFSSAYNKFSNKCLKAVVQFLIDVFAENAYTKNVLTRITKDYLNNINKTEHNFANIENNYKYTIKIS